jgi:hypothetical protein
VRKILDTTVLALVLLFYKPLRSALSRLSKVQFGDVSVELNRRALSIGGAELAQSLRAISPQAVRVLIEADPKDKNITLVWTTGYGEPGKGPKLLRVPPHEQLDALRELEERGLVEFESQFSDFNEFRRILGELDTWPDENYIPAERLEDNERFVLESQFAQLTSLGGKAYDAIIDVVVSQFGLDTKERD